MLANMKSCHTRMPSSSHRSWKVVGLVDHRARRRAACSCPRPSAARARRGSRRGRRRGGRGRAESSRRRGRTRGTPLTTRPNPSPSASRSTSSVRKPTRPRSMVDRFAVDVDRQPDRIQRLRAMRVRPPPLDVRHADGRVKSDRARQHACSSVTGAVQSSDAQRAIGDGRVAAARAARSTPHDPVVAIELGAHVGLLRRGVERAARAERDATARPAPPADTRPAMRPSSAVRCQRSC